jgi:hypothetical protein
MIYDFNMIPYTNNKFFPKYAFSLSEKLRRSGRSDDQCLKVIEDFIGKARKLENDLLR